jgi:hypothetical protein
MIGDKSNNYSQNNMLVYLPIKCVGTGHREEQLSVPRLFQTDPLNYVAS